MTPELFRRPWKSARHAALLAGFLACTGGAASSQTNTNNPGNTSGGLRAMTLEELGNIEVVTATKKPEEARKTPAAVFVITQEDIRRYGATSIPEVLRLAPGVEVSRIDSGHWAIGIRGFQGQFSRAVLVVVDGRTVYTPLFAGVFWDVQDVPFDDIERIEVIRGPGGTIWGANAFEGVINIITRNAKDTHGVLATAGGGNVDQLTAGVREGGGIGQSFDYRTYGKVFSRGPEFHANKKQFDDWRMGQFGFRTDWNTSAIGTTTLQGDIYRGEVGEEVDVAQFAPQSETTLYGNDRVSGGNLRGKWNRDLGWAGGVQVGAYFDRTNRTAPHFKETRNTFDLDFLHHFKVPGRQNISWGLGARWSPSTFTSYVPTISIMPQSMPYTLYSGFAEDEFKIVPENLSLFVGAKLENNSYTGLETQPSARLLWTPDTRQSFWTAVTRAFRTPSRLDRDFSVKGFLAPSFYLQIAGDSGFNAERLTGFEAGYRNLITPHLHVDLSAFHNQYRDLSSLSSGAFTIQTVPIIYAQLGFHYVNGIMGSTDGYELAPEWTPLRWLEFKGSYSHLQMNLKNQPGNADTSTVASLEGSSAHHRAVVQAHIQLPANLELDQTYRYVSALPTQNVAAYETADARLGWHCNVGSNKLELSLVGQNLFQPQHVEFGHNTQQQVEIARGVYAKMTWTH